ncbi:hypothetical protein GGR55DRAFT_681744 [Xylaria sp. FL0064]|nr:hypothetical protein GGR55DRAFT_681744 [Xylaria sp. FL0064]
MQVGIGAFIATLHSSGGRSTAAMREAWKDLTNVRCRRALVGRARYDKTAAVNAPEPSDITFGALPCKALVTGHRVGFGFGSGGSYYSEPEHTHSIVRLFND